MAFPLNGASLDIASNALDAEQQVMEVISQNVANVDTPGYNEQTAVLETGIPTPPSNYPNPMYAGQMGSGVQVTSIQNSFLQSLQTLYQGQNQTVGSMTTSSQILQEVQSIMGESGTSGISTLMQNFFQSVQSLSQNPSDEGAGTAMLQAATQLADGIHSLNTNLNSIIGDANQTVTGDVQQINTLASQIASLNDQIRATQAQPGQNANDLLDQRNQLFNQLSNLVNIQVSIEPNGSSIVSIGGNVLVQDDQVTQLGTYTDANGNTQVDFTNNPNVPIPLSSGSLYGTINTRDNVIGNIATPGTLLNQLNTFVYQFVQNVNSTTMLGYTPGGNTDQPLFNDDPDNDGNVDAGVGAVPAGANLNWLADINVAITDPSNIASSVASVFSVQNVNNAADTVDASQSLATESGNFLTAPAANGTITINGVNINWTNAQSLDEIITDINDSNAGVTATFDPTSQEIELQRNTTENQNYAGGFPGDSQITVADASGNLSQVLLINTTNNTLTGTAAANTTGTAGDNTNLNFLSGLQNSNLAALGNTSVTQYYDGIVSNLGTQTSNAQTGLSSGQAILQQIQTQQQSYSGVNLNDEATALTNAQNAYDAAARVETAMISIFTTLNSLPGAG